MLKRYLPIFSVLGLLAVAVILFFGLKFFSQKLQTESVVLAPQATLQDLGPARDFKLKLLDGNKFVSLKTFKGKPLVINFWASWCPPCRQEAPTLSALARKYQRQVQFLGIIFQDTEPQVRAYIKEFNVPYPNAWDPKQEAANTYGITGVPETYFIDSQGRLRGKWIGAINAETLESFLSQLSKT